MNRKKRVNLLLATLVTVAMLISLLPATVGAAYEYSQYPYWEQTTTYTWDVNKEADTCGIVLDRGDSGDVGYAITVTRNAVVTDVFGVSGTTISDRTTVEVQRQRYNGTWRTIATKSMSDHYYDIQFIPHASSTNYRLRFSGGEWAPQTSSFSLPTEHTSSFTAGSTEATLTDTRELPEDSGLSFVFDNDEDEWFIDDNNLVDGVFTVSYLLTITNDSAAYDDYFEVCNTAELDIDGVDPSGVTVSVYTLPKAEITISKTANRTSAYRGNTVTYTIGVTNTGDVDLYDVTVTDAMLEIDEYIGFLEKDDDETIVQSYTIPSNTPYGDLVNTATVTAGTCPGDYVSDVITFYEVRLSDCRNLEKSASATVEVKRRTYVPDPEPEPEPEPEDITDIEEVPDVPEVAQLVPPVADTITVDTAPEVPAAGEELPKTSAADILLLGLGAMVATGGVLYRRKRK
jgi:LPXTG-motif cell wall-anchored protein